MKMTSYPRNSKLLQKTIEYISNEIFNDNENKVFIKEKIVGPMMNILYSQLQPYIILLIVCIIFIVLSSILNLVFFCFMYLKR